MLISLWFCTWGGYTPTLHSLKRQLSKSAIRLILKACSSSTILCASPNPDGIWLNALLADRMEISKNETCLASSLYTFGLIFSPLIKPFYDWQKLMTSRSADGTKYFQFSLQDNRHPEHWREEKFGESEKSYTKDRSIRIASEEAFDRVEEGSREMCGQEWASAHSPEIKLPRQIHKYTLGQLPSLRPSKPTTLSWAPQHSMEWVSNCWPWSP